MLGVVPTPGNPGRDDLVRPVIVVMRPCLEPVEGADLEVLQKAVISAEGQ